MESRRFDAVVVGAGVAGTASALQLARAGRRVGLVEKRALKASGFRCVQSVPPWMFERAGLAPSRPPERREAESSIVVRGRHDQKLITLRKAPAWSVDIGLLLERLQTEALEAGVVPFEHARAERLVSRGERPRSLTISVSRSDGRERRLEVDASLFVDASGTSRTLLDQLPRLARKCPEVLPEDICLASQEVCEVTDREGAASFLEKLGAKTDEETIWSGTAGSYSTLNVNVARDLRTVSLLGGAIEGRILAADADPLTPLKLKHPWIGKVISGSRGRIPLRRPYSQLVAPGIALVGQAGCQVFPAHGCGVGASLIAARELGKAVGGRGDPGSLEALWRYQVSFQRERGAVHCAYDRFRKVVQSLETNELEALYRAGLITTGGMSSTMNQRLITMTSSDRRSLSRGALREPRLAARMAAGVGPMQAVYLTGRCVPPWPVGRLLRKWSRLVGRWLWSDPDYA